MDRGITPEKLIYYGLEYKYITEHLSGQTTYEEMFTRLETAIHRFAKRQMTWFKKDSERMVFHQTFVISACWDRDELLRI